MTQINVAKQNYPDDQKDAAQASTPVVADTIAARLDDSIDRLVVIVADLEAKLERYCGPHPPSEQRGEKDPYLDEFPAYFEYLNNRLVVMSGAVDRLNILYARCEL